MAYVIIAVGFGLSGGIIGKLKGSSFFLWFLISGAVPFIGLFAAIAYRVEREELRRECPQCGRVTKIYEGTNNIQRMVISRALSGEEGREGRVHACSA